jgi:GTPase
MSQILGPKAASEVSPTQKELLKEALSAAQTKSALLEDGLHQRSEELAKMDGKFASFIESDIERSDSIGLNGSHLKIDKIDSEPQEGNIEYKRMLIEPSEQRLQHLTTQLKWRVLEGRGEAIYAIGVEDDGTCIGITEEDLLASLRTLKKMADAAGCETSLVRQQEGRKGWCAEVLVRQMPSHATFIDMRIAIVGNVDSGKSTMVGVLTSGRLDNGRGLARSSIFRHRHELESGRTSSITQHIMGIKASGEIVNYKNRCVSNCTFVLVKQVN